MSNGVGAVTTACTATGTSTMAGVGLPIPSEVVKYETYTGEDCTGDVAAVQYIDWKFE